MTQLDIERADKLVRRRKFPQAIEIFRALLSAEPMRCDLRERVGDAYRLSGNDERAFHHFHRGAKIALNSGDRAMAFRLLKSANAVSANEPDILFNMAECAEAVAPNEFEPLLRQLIATATASGDRRRLWALERICTLRPDDMGAQAGRAMALAEAGRIDVALEVWKAQGARMLTGGIDVVGYLQQTASAIEERPDLSAEIGTILLLLGRPREALAVLVPHYEKHPEDVTVLATLVDTLEALQAHDKIVPARVELIKARVRRGQREQAFEEITQLIEIAHDDPIALEVSAHAYATFGFRGDASQLWRRLVDLFTERGDARERYRAIFNLLKISPDDPDALRLGIDALQGAGQDREAAMLKQRLGQVARTRDQGSIPAVDAGLTDGLTLEPKTDSAVASSPLRPPISRDDTGIDEVSETFVAAPTGPMRTAQARWDTGTVALGDEDVLEVFAEDSSGALPASPSDVFALGDPSEPGQEPMPVANVPTGAQLLQPEAGPPTQQDEQAQMPTNVSPATTQMEAADAVSLYEKLFTGEYDLASNLPPEEAQSEEETTSRTQVSDEIRELRAGFEEDLPTRLHVHDENGARVSPSFETYEGPTTTLPPDQVRRFLKGLGGGD